LKEISASEGPDNPSDLLTKPTLVSLHLSRLAIPLTFLLEGLSESVDEMEETRSMRYVELAKEKKVLVCWKERDRLEKSFPMLSLKHFMPISRPDPPL
jgi:hypothetical protein